MAENQKKAELITVSCPECNKKRFSFSENAISEKRNIQFICPECSSNVQISLTHEGDIFVQCIL